MEKRNLFHERREHTDEQDDYERRHSQVGDKPRKSQLSGSLTAKPEARASANIVRRVRRESRRDSR